MPTTSLLSDVTAQIIPRVYGDFSEGGVIGPIPAVRISDDGLVYAAADTPVEAIEEVWVGLEEQTSGYTVDLSHEEEGRPPIATITFAQRPFGLVSWRGRGKQDASGNLIRNPIAQLVDLMTTLGRLAPDQIAPGPRAEAQAACDRMGYETAWVVADSRIMLDWIAEWMANIHGIPRIRGDERLAFIIDEGTWATGDQIAANIVASRDCDDGDAGPEWELDIAQTMNEVEVDYQWSWPEQRPSAVYEQREHRLFNLFSQVRLPRLVELKGHRNAAGVAAWVRVLFERQTLRYGGSAGAIVRIPVERGKAAHVVPGDLITLSWPWGPAREQGLPYLNQILRVTGSRVQSAAGGVTQVTARDTGQYLVGSARTFHASVLLDSAQPLGGGGRLLELLPWEGVPRMVTAT